MMHGHTYKTEGILTTLQINIKNKGMIGVINRIFFAYPLLFYGVPVIRFFIKLLV
jgi:hypothetical protein